MTRPQSHTYRDIWEKHNKRKIPLGCHIHHIDGNAWNEDPENLQCVTPEEHYLIHKNQGDHWAAAAILSHITKTGYGNDLHDWDDYYPSYSDISLFRIFKTLNVISRRAYDKGLKPIEIITYKSMDWVVDKSEVYSEPDVEFILNKLKPRDRFLLEASFGINRDKMTIKELAVKFETTSNYINQKKRRLIKKIRDEMVFT